MTNPQSLIKAPARHICCLHAYTGPTTTRGPLPSSCVSLFSGLEKEGAEHECTVRWMVQAIKGNGGTMFRVASFGDFCLIQVCNVKSTQRAAGCYGNPCCRCWSRCVRDTWGFQETCAPCSDHSSDLTQAHKNKTPGAGPLMRSTLLARSTIICFVARPSQTSSLVQFVLAQTIFTHTINKLIA